MTQLVFELILDEPRIGRIIRANNWVLTTFPDGHGEWNYERRSGKEITRLQGKEEYRSPRRDGDTLRAGLEEEERRTLDALRRPL